MKAASEAITDSNCGMWVSEAFSGILTNGSNLMERRNSIDNPSKTSHQNPVMRESRPDFAAGKCYWGSCPKEVQAKADCAQVGQTSDNPVSAQKDPKEAQNHFLSQTIIEMENLKVLGPPQDVLNRYEQKAEQHWRKIYQRFYPNGFNGSRGEKGYIAFIKALDDHAKNLVQDINFFRHIKISELEHLLANPDEKFPAKCDSKYPRKVIKRGLKNKAFYNYPNDNTGPWHGYLSTNENGSKEGIDEALKEVYGAIRLRLKKEKLIGKSTVTFDDSWHYYQLENNDITIVPRPLVQPDRKVFPIEENRAVPYLQEKLSLRREGHREPIRAMDINAPLKNEEIRRLVEQLFNSKVERSDEEDHKLIVQLENLLNKEKGIDYLVNPLNIKSINDVQPYAEFQYHFTDLKVDDIDKAYLPMYDDNTEASIKNIIKGLNSINIKYEFY
jgi:hypothetical protein